MPSIPTDNLYKFSAISGVWMLFGLLVLYGWLINLDLEIKKELRATQAYFTLGNTLKNVEKRLDTITQGKMDEARSPLIPTSFSIEQERSFLTKISKNIKSEIEKNKHFIDANSSEALEVFERTDVQVFFIVYLFFTVIFVVYGFIGWKTKLHDVELEIRKLDLETRRKMLEKLEFELKKERRARWSKRR